MTERRGSAGRSRKRGPRVLTVVLAAATVGACEPESGQATLFALGQPLELGMFTIKARRMETVADPPPIPLGSLQAQPGEKVIAVFVHWAGLDGLEPMDRRVFIESFLEHRLTVVDEAGERAAAFHAMPADLYHGMPGQLSEQEWVVVFHVWVDSRDFTLLVVHPDPEPGGFEVAAIPLTS